MLKLCCAVHEMELLIAQGTACRRVGHTEMNRESSRSHSVLICTVESRTTDEHGLINTLRARLNMVDLAGGRTIPRAMHGMMRIKGENSLRFIYLATCLKLSCCGWDNTPLFAPCFEKFVQLSVLTHRTFIVSLVWRTMRL